MTVVAAGCISGELIMSVCHPREGDPVTLPASASPRCPGSLHCLPERSDARTRLRSRTFSCESGVKHLPVVTAAARPEQDVD